MHDALRVKPSVPATRSPWTGDTIQPQDRGRDGAMNAAPPSEPDWQVSRIRLSSQKLATTRRLMSSSFQAFQVEDAQRVPDGQGLSPRRIVTLHSAAAPSKLRGIKMIPRNSIYQRHFPQ